MENSSVAPPSQAGGAAADPFRFDELQERLSVIEKSTAAPEMIPATEHSLEHLCRTMCSRGLAEHLCRTLSRRGLQKLLEPAVSEFQRFRRRYQPHKLSVSDVPEELRVRVRAALKLAPNPADLVYECSKYVKDGQGYVLFMELFLRMISDGEVVIASSTVRAAHGRARRWHDMYRARGGWGDDHRIEARAFLFFIASFGIPDDFPGDYVMNLIILSHPSEVSETLRQSRVLVPMIPGMVEKMLEHKLYAEAIDVALTFGIEDKFPVDPILALFRAEYGRASMELKTYNSVTELEKAGLELEYNIRSLDQVLMDHKLQSVFDLGGEFTRYTVEKALRALVSEGNDDGAVEGKRKRGEDEMDTEQPSSALARRLLLTHAQGKRRWTEPIACYLI